MASRLELHELLCETLGSRQVYFQPPSSIRMKYPAIIYSRSRIGNKFANDFIYNQSYQYSITVIDEDPDSEIVERVSKLPMCSFDRHYTADNLNHDTFTIYY